jgi:hypothetical protein
MAFGERIIAISICYDSWFYYLIVTIILFIVTENDLAFFAAFEITSWIKEHQYAAKVVIKNAP